MRKDAHDKSGIVGTDIAGQMQYSLSITEIGMQNEVSPWNPVPRPR
jgi:hypothetical protein